MLNLTENKEKGFVALLITILVLIFMLNLAISMNTLLFGSQKISENVVKSTQSYYTAEAGVEDSLLRLKNTPQMPLLSYNLTINDTTANVVIPEIVGGSRVITSRGDSAGRIKKMQAVYSIDAQVISFHYGAQVGEGGLQMSNGSKIMGNVFSNGNVTGSGIIDNNVIVANSSTRIENIHVNGDALMTNCLNSTIDGNLTYVAGGSIQNCTVHGTTSVQSDQISPLPLPISQNQVNGWKDDAAAGDVITNNISITNGATSSMGPVKIIGSLNVSNNATLKLTGTIYVTGNINISNGAKIKLDSSYGSLSGIILSDSTITVGNNATLTGSGQSGSYIMALSTSSSNYAINVSNNGEGAIFYTTSGGILLSNNIKVREATGYKITLDNNAVIQYDSGLANSFFSSGPGGGWKVTSWEEK